MPCDPSASDMILVAIFFGLSMISAETGLADTVTISTQNVTGCLPPSILDNTELVPSLSEYPHHFTVTLSCVNGSMLVGPKIMTCLQTGNWSSTQSYCMHLACAVLVTPPHGTVEILKDSDTSEVFAKYSCEDKYELLGKATSRCKPDGNWTEPVPTCSRTCVPAVVPLNGSVHMDCAYQNCTALFMCHEGYTLVGDKMSLCQEGMWVHQHIPTCKKTYCLAPPQVNNSVSTVNISQESFAYGVTVAYSCVLNYTLYGNHSLRCGREGKWLGQVPYCTENRETTLNDYTSVPITPTITQSPVTCPSPGPLLHGKYTSSNFQTVIYKCDRGFRLRGDSKRTCQQNQTWSNVEPECVRDSLANDTVSTPVPPITEKMWRTVFLQYREWEGTYVYWEEVTRFKLLVLENKHPSSQRIEGLFIDNKDAKLHLIISFRPPTLHFEMSRLIEPSERFLPGKDWAFDGDLRQHHQHWQFIATSFHTQPGFEKLRMSPKRDYSPPPIPHFTEQDLTNQPSLKAIALALGVVIAVVAIILAAALAAFLVRRKALKAGGHRSVTSFENPVYEYQNGIKTAEQYQEQYREPTDC